jgi:hypothetical protein
MIVRAGKLLTSAVLAIALVAASGGQARGCPNCKEAVTSSEGETSSAAMGYNWSVAFMLIVPFSMVGTGMLIVRRAAKRGMLPEL